MEEYKEILEEILNYLDLLKNEYKYYKGEEKEYDGLPKDGTHIAELANLDAIGLMLFISDFRKLLRERREIIDNLQILKKIRQIIDDEFIEKLEELYKTIDYEIRKKNNREYKARSDKGLELIAKYSDEGDDLVSPPNNKDLEELKEQLEMANVS